MHLSKPWNNIPKIKILIQQPKQITCFIIRKSKKLRITIAIGENFKLYNKIKQYKINMKHTVT